MEKQITHNAYLKELETVLAGVKAQLIEAEHATHVDYKSKNITEKASEQDKKLKKTYYNKTVSYLKDLTEMNNTAYELQLISDKIITMSTIASTDETNATAQIANSARSIEKAMEDVQILCSLAASVNAKTITEDSKTPVSRAAGDVNQKGLEAAKAAEIATMSSLNSTIFAAESNARFLNSTITDFSSSIDALIQNITKTKTDATTHETTAFTDLQAALKKLNDDEKALEKAHLDWKSAEAANEEDTIKLGLREAQKQVIEDERKTVTNPKK